jgi:agmatinase
MQQIFHDGHEITVKSIKKALEDCERVYLTIDMDVLDPAFAPAVQNPEPEGMSTRTLMDIVGNLCDRRVVGLDLVEVAPIYDHGITALVASKILFEILGILEDSRMG